MSSLDIEKEQSDHSQPSKSDLAESQLGRKSRSIHSKDDEDDEPEDTVTGLHPVLEWDGPDDPANPRNWAFRKRVFNTGVTSINVLLVSFTSTSYPPAIPLIMKRFHVSQELAIAGLSLYLLGMGLGPLMTAPMSELFGRKYIYICCLASLLLFSAGAGSAQNIWTILICRFFAGLLGSGSIAVAAGTIADIWDLVKDGGVASLGVVLSPNIGISIGYVCSASIISDTNNNWRFSQWIILIVGAPIFISNIFLSETYKRTIIVSRLKARGTPIAANPHPIREIRRQMGVNIIRPVHMMITEPLVGYLSLYSGFSFGVMFSFLASYAFIFETFYDFGHITVGLMFLGILPGFVIGLTICGIFDKTLYKKARIAAGGNPAPEHRLYAAMLGSLVLPVALFWYAWSPRKDVHWVVPFLSGIPFGIGIMTILIPTVMYLIDVYRSEAGASALASIGLLRYLLGAAFPLFTVQMYTNLGTGWAGSLFAFIAIAMMPLPWVFFKYGKALRARSSYVVAEF